MSSDTLYNVIPSTHLVYCRPDTLYMPVHLQTPKQIYYTKHISYTKQITFTKHFVYTQHHVYVPKTVYTATYMQCIKPKPYINPTYWVPNFDSLSRVRCVCPGFCVISECYSCQFHPISNPSGIDRDGAIQGLVCMLYGKILCCVCSIFDIGFQGLMCRLWEKFYVASVAYLILARVKQCQGCGVWPVGICQWEG